MQYIKRSDRFIKTKDFTKPFKLNGGSVREVAEYAKWRTLDEDAKVQMTMTILGVSVGGNTAYILKDSLGMMACYPTPDLKEVKEFLTQKGFKPIKDWYIQDYGMTEETWNEWNKSND